MRKFLAVMLLLCLLVNVSGFTEMAETVAEFEDAALELTSAPDEDTQEEPADAEEAPVTVTITVAAVEGGVRLSVDTEDAVIWQAQPGTDVTAADEAAWEPVAEGTSCIVAPTVDTLYRAVLEAEEELTVSDVVAVAAVNAPEAAEEAEAEEPILSLSTPAPKDGDENELPIISAATATPEPVVTPAPVTPAYVLSGANVLAVGKSATLAVKLNGKTVKASALKWVSDNTAVATVSTAGKVTAKKAGTVTITATSKTDAKLFGTFVLTVYPATTKVTVSAEKKVLDLATRETLQLTAKCAAKAASDVPCQDVTWKSSSTKIATVSADGVVTPVKVGKVTITATAKDGTKKYGTIVLNVVKAVTGIAITGADEVRTEKSITLKAVLTPADATNKKVTWTTSDKSVATVSTSGVVKAAALSQAKTVTITLRSVENPEITAEKIITVRPKVTKVSIDGKSAYIGIDESLQLHATCEPESADSSVTWKSDNTQIATVDAKTGKVTGKKLGKVTITATATDGSKNTAKVTLTVVKAVREVTITGADEVMMGRSIRLKAEITPTDATIQNVTWTTSDPSVATVSGRGIVKAIMPKEEETEVRTVMITATSKENPDISAEKEITICPYVEGMLPLEGIVIGLDPGHQRYANNQKEQWAPWSKSTKKKVSSGTGGVKTHVAEYIVNLDVALQLRDALEELGCTVVMTRTTHDVDISNRQRALMMNAAGVDLWLRIHCNSADKSGTQGMGMYVVKSGDTAKESYYAGECLLKAMGDATGAKKTGVHVTNAYTGNNWSERPCVLVEMGYMSNSREDVLLNDPVYQEKLVEGMVNGICEFVGR